MAYRSILVELDHDHSAAVRIALAADLADRFDALLIGYANVPILAPLVADAAFYDPAIVDQLRRDAEARVGELEAEFRHLAGNRRVEWRSAVGGFDADRAVMARAADLIITECPLPGVSPHVGDRGDLIGRAGRPVLVAGPESGALRTETVLVAWKDTAEARRAVRDAVPLLRLASDVLVLEVLERDAASDAPADVAAFLSRHGIPARSATRAREQKSTAATIEAAAAEIGANLVVAGAYGHSRMREWAFGGVTRELLESPRVHRLLAA